ncbi:MAG: recombinase family protein [Candidatus Nanopelagicales bacterium]
MKLIAYLRVSSEGQLDGHGLDVQEAHIRRWAKANRHRIVAVVSDEGVSGSKDAVDRPGLTEVLSALQRPLSADGMVVTRLDRLARQLTVQEAVLGLVWREEWKVFAADEGGEVLEDDPDDPMRTAIRQMRGVFAQLDKSMTVKKLRDGRRAKSATGKKAVGEYAFGFRGEGKGRDRDAAPDTDEQAAVAKILGLRKRGATYRDIANALDSDGLKPRRAESWSAMSVRSVVLRAEGRESRRAGEMGTRSTSTSP